MHAFRLLTARDWVRLGATGLRAAIHVLDTNREAINGVALECGIKPALAEICEVLICGDSEGSGDSPGPVSSEKCGPLQVMHYPLPPELEHWNWSVEIWEALAEGSGVFRTIHEIFCVAKSTDARGLRHLLASVNDDIDVLRVLPDHLTAFLPERCWEDNYSRIGEDNVLAAATVPRRTEIRIDRHFSLGSEEEPEPKEWDNFIENYPWIALNFLSELPLRRNPGPGNQNYLETPKGAGRLISVCQKQPYLLRAFPELWGKLLRCSQESAEEVRSAICSVSAGPVVTKGYAIGIHPFELRLPDEAALLPHVLDASVQQSAFWYPPFDDDPARNVRGREAVEQSVTNFLSHPGPLLGITCNEELRSEVRAAAAMLYLLHPQRDLGLQAMCQENLVKLYTIDMGGWYLRAAATALEGAIFEEDPGALSAMGRLLQAGRTDFEGRLALDPVLDRWRQRSRAPVQAAPSSQLWIS